MGALSLAARLVEVIADLGESAHPRYRYGSGCVVAGSTVLTAAHVVIGAQSVHVRDRNKELHSATLDERFVGDAEGPGPDLALVTIDTPTSDPPAIPLGVVDRDSADAEPVERCHAVGYPWFAVRRSPDAVRDTVDAYGHVPVLSKLTSGLLSLNVSGPPRPLPPASASLAGSEWSGMSGAPVVASGCLLGVVTEHAAREGSGTITITPLSALEADSVHPTWGPGVADAASWWARLGVVGLAALKRLPPRRVRSEPAYRATVREIQMRTRELRGRERELAGIAAFATSSERYRWLVGEAWTGKTALLATAVAALPQEVDSVSYFLSRREADADSSRFLGAVVPQLADLLDEDPPIADKDHFRALWEKACSRAERHLLLVVDGLDEDLHAAGLPSVAALLPIGAGGRAHVLVSSRPYLELPADVLPEHPLRATPPTALEPFEGAAQLAALARQELDELKRRDDGLATDVLAVLTAAAGPLTVRDLATLTTDVGPPSPAHTRAVRHLVAESAARTLQPVGTATNRRYQFAHVSLLEYAQTDEDLTDPDYRQRIHQWAQDWAARGWPMGDESATTPRYLLDVYPATLGGDSKHPARPQDLQRLGELVSNIGWVDTAITQVGVDSVISSLRTAADVTSPEASVGDVLRMLESRAHQLRRPHVANQVGYAATALAWRALALGGLDQVVAAASKRLRNLPPPQLIPSWTTERVSRSLVSVLGRHQGLTAVAMTGEGLAVSGGGDGVIRLWDPRTPGDPGREVGHQDGRVTAVAVTGEGLIVSGGGDGVIRLWDPSAPDDPGRELGHHVDPGVFALAVTADGLVVSGGAEDWAVRLWDPHTPSDRGRRLGGHVGGVRALAVTTEGLVVSGGADQAVRIWDPRTPGDTGREVGHHNGPVYALAVTRDGMIVSGGLDGAVRLWDPGTAGDPGRELGRHQTSVNAVAVTGEGLVVSGGSDRSVCVWDPSTPNDPGRELGRHETSVTAVAVTGEGFVVAGSVDGALQVWDHRTARDPPSHHSGVSAIAATGDGLVVTGGVGREVRGGTDGTVLLGYDGAVRLWDPGTPRDPGRELGHHDSQVYAVAVTGEGLVASGDNAGAIRLWDPRTPGDPGHQLGSHVSTVGALAGTIEGLVVSGGYDGAVRLWDPRNPGDPGRELGHHDGWVAAVAVAVDGRIVSAGYDGAVRLWDPGTPGDPGRELGHHDSPVIAVAVTGEGIVAAGDNAGAIRLWDPGTAGDLGRELGRHETSLNAVAVTGEGLVVSGGSDGTLLLWDPRSPAAPGRELARHEGGVIALATGVEGQLSVVTPAGITIFSMTTPPS